MPIELPIDVSDLSGFALIAAVTKTVGPLVRALIAVVLVLLAVFAARAFQRLVDSLSQKLLPHLPEWAAILLQGSNRPACQLLRGALLYFAVAIFPWPVGWSAAVHFLNTKVFRVLVLYLILRALWDSSGVCRLLLRSAQNHLDLNTNLTICAFFEKIYRALLAVLGAISIVNEFADVTALITGAGLVGLTFSLAAQSAVSDLVAGVSLVLEHPFGIGDWITVGGHEGTVVEISFRSTKLRTVDNALITIKNSAIYNSDIQNIAGRTSRLIAFPIGMTYDSTPEQLLALRESLTRLFSTTEGILPETVEVNVSEFSASSIDLECRFYTTFLAIKDFRRLKNDLNLAIIQLVKEHGCSFAFPSTSVYLEKTPESAPTVTPIP